MSKYTKGKWELDPQTGKITAEGNLVAQVFGATVHNQEANVGECFANARLITNAPMLYYILKPLFEPKAEHHFSELLSAMRRVQNVIETIDEEAADE